MEYIKYWTVAWIRAGRRDVIAIAPRQTAVVFEPVVTGEQREMVAAMWAV